MSKTLTYMEILAAVAEQPRLPTKLAHICNINYTRLGEYVDPLEARGYVKREMLDSHEVYAITSEGLRLHQDFEKLRSRFPT